MRYVNAAPGPAGPFNAEFGSRPELVIPGYVAAPRTRLLESAVGAELLIDDVLAENSEVMGGLAVVTTLEAQPETSDVAVSPEYFVTSQTLEVIPIETGDVSGSPAESNHLALFRDIVPDSISTNAKDVLGMHDVVSTATCEAEAIAREKSEQARLLATEGRFDEIPDPVDYMSTAGLVGEARREFGNDSPEYKQKRMGLWYNQARRVREAIRRGTYEIFEELPQTLDGSGNLVADGFSVDKLHEDGISPVVASEELQRAINDFVRLKVNKELLTQPGAENQATFGIWPCPKYVLEAYEANPDNFHAFGDYVPHIKKMMIVRDRLVPETQTIYHEQVGVSGGIFTEEVIATTLQLMGTLQPGECPEDVHGMIGSIPEEVTAIDILKTLDLVASRVHGIEIFMGETMETGQSRDYETVLEEADQRRMEQEDLVDRFTNFVEMIEEHGLETRVATGLIDKWLKKELFKLAKHDLEVAEIIFDHKTAMAIARASGDSGKLAEAEASAPPVGGCGAGACGLEAVDLSSSLGQKIKEKLDVQDGEEVLHDIERACPECGETSVYYSYTESYVKKACVNDECGYKNF